MREPDVLLDGWCLESGEAYNSAAPQTFWLPPKDVREGLQVGDLAKLIFRIAIESPDRGEAVERMWVLVRERKDDGYLGVLDNEPTSIDENDEFWVGTEVPFSAKHVIDVDGRDEHTLALAQQEPRRPWRG